MKNLAQNAKCAYICTVNTRIKQGAIFMYTNGVPMCSVPERADLHAFCASIDNTKGTPFLLEVV